MKKDAHLPFTERKTIDDDKTATKAIVSFCGAINKSPLYLISFALDGDGTNTFCEHFKH